MNFVRDNITSPHQCINQTSCLQINSQPIHQSKIAQHQIHCHTADPYASGVRWHKSKLEGVSFFVDPKNHHAGTRHCCIWLCAKNRTVFDIAWCISLYKSSIKLYSVSGKKEKAKMLFVISPINLGPCWRNLVYSFLNKSAAKSFNNFHLTE